MGKGRKQVILSKGQSKISNFFIKQTEDKQSVLCDKNIIDSAVQVHTSSYFGKDVNKSPTSNYASKFSALCLMKNDGTSPVKKSLPEVVIIDDDVVSPAKIVVNNEENCDFIIATPKQSSAAERELSIEESPDITTTPKQPLSAKRRLSVEESPDVIPATPVSKKKRSNLSSKRTKLSSKIGIVKLEKNFPKVGDKQCSVIVDSIDNVIVKDNSLSVLDVKDTSMCCDEDIEIIFTEQSKSPDKNSSSGSCINKSSSEKTLSCEYSSKDKSLKNCTEFGTLLDAYRNVDKNVSRKFGNMDSGVQDVDNITSKCESQSVKRENKPNHSVIDDSGICEHDLEMRNVIVSDVSSVSDISIKPISQSVSKIEDSFHEAIDVVTETVQGRYEDSTSDTSVIKTEPCVNKTKYYLNKSTDSSNTNNKAFKSGSLSNENGVSNKSEKVTFCAAAANENGSENSRYLSVNAETKDADCNFQKTAQFEHDDIMKNVVTTCTNGIVNSASATKSSDCAPDMDYTKWLCSEDWDFSSVDGKETEKLTSEKKEELNLEEFQRCRILEIGSGQKKWEKVLKLQSTSSEATTSCLLQGFWVDSNLDVDDIISIKARHSEPGHAASWYIGSSEGLLVHHPDTLISSTAVVGSLFCPRRGVLTEWFRGIDSDSPIMVIGSLVHELLQEVLERKLRTASAITSLVQELLSRSDCVHMLYSARMSKEDAVKELDIFVPRIANFVDTYVDESASKFTSPLAKNGERTEKWNGTICAIRDIEENIWSPKLGVKGKVDVTVEVKIHKKNIKRVVPLELKTGRSSFSDEHKGQVTLYTMMMSELGNRVDAGLLLYLRDGTMREIKAGNNDRRGLIMLRNQLAHFITRPPAVTDGARFKPPQLPEPINHHSACGKCPYLTVCTSFLRRDGLPSLSESNPLASLVTTTTSHLSESHIDYLIHWTGLVLLEDLQTSGPVRQRDLWCRKPEEREKRGKSLCSMVIKDKVVESGDSYIHTFQKSSGQFDLRSSSLVVGEYVTVSTDDRLAVTSGTICDITQTTVTLLLNRDLTKHISGSSFHIDIYTLQSGKVFNLTNLGCLMEATDTAANLRRFIIDKQCPTFVERLSSSVMRPGRPILEPLNMGQRRAVLKALTANDYFLIKGMPGTGKTATIVSLVELLVKLGQSVIVTSHTHSAVDNVLVKLADRGVDLLRLGSSSRIHPQLRAKSDRELTANCASPAQLEALYDSKPVVGTTCLGAGHSLFTRREFDVCVVDESTQVLQISVLRPLFSAKKFILIGDPEQLPPVIRSKMARDMGMSESLFARLDSPDATVCLELQYRMNQTITDVANGLTYNGQLKCGNEEVSNATLQLPASHMITKVLESEVWLMPVLSDTLEQSVLVLDTGPIWKKLKSSTVGTNGTFASREVTEERSSEERACTNLYEAAIIQHITAVLMSCGVHGSSIGVIAPYRAQVALLRKVVACDRDAEVEVNTVDQYQGRDKEVIIFSCTRTENVDATSGKDLPAKSKESEILGDKRRLTVAITRAKHKLIIVGDMKTLQNYQPFKQLFDCLLPNQITVLSDGNNDFDWNRIIMNLNNSGDNMCPS